MTDDQVFKVEVTIGFFARIPPEDAGDAAADQIGEEIERLLKSSDTFGDLGVYAESFDVEDWKSVPVQGYDE